MANSKTEVKTLTIFNTKLTVIEVRKLMKHSGPIMYSNTEHNKKAVAAYLHKVLQKAKKI